MVLTISTDVGTNPSARSEFVRRSNVLIVCRPSIAIWRYASAMDRIAIRPTIGLSRWTHSTRGLIPTIAICGTSPSTAGTIPARLDDFGRCVRGVQLGFWKPDT
jgi:hypothetical protein